MTEKQADTQLKPTGIGIKQRIHKLYHEIKKVQYLNQYIYIITAFLLFIAVKSLSGLKMHQIINTLAAVPKDINDFLAAAVFALIVNMLVIYLLSIFLLRFFIIKFNLDIECIKGWERFLYSIGSCFVHATVYITVISCNLHLKTWGNEFIALSEHTFGRIIVQIYRMVFDIINVIIPDSGISQAITIFLFFGLVCFIIEYRFKLFINMIADIDLFNLICPFLPIFIIFTSLQIYNDHNSLNKLIISLLIFPVILATILLTYIISDWFAWNQFYIDLPAKEEGKKKLRLTVNNSLIKNKNYIIFTAVSFIIYFLTEIITKINSQYFIDSLLNFNSVYDAENVLNQIEITKTSTSNITLILAITTIISLFYDAYINAVKEEEEYVLVTERLLIVLGSNNVYLTIQLWLTYFDSKNAISMSGIVKTVGNIVNSIGDGIDYLYSVIVKAGIVVEVIYTIAALVLTILFFIVLVKFVCSVIGTMLVLVFMKYVPFLLSYTIIAYISQNFIVDNMKMKFIFYGATLIVSYLVSQMQQKFLDSNMMEDNV